MVEKEGFKGVDSFKCEICGFHYTQKKQAEKCEESCVEGRCSDEITKNSLERSN